MRRTRGSELKTLDKSENVNNVGLSSKPEVL
jgi:hypothetical protein